MAYVEVEVNVSEHIGELETQELLEELEGRNVHSRIPMASEAVRGLVEEVRRATYARDQSKFNEAVGDYFWQIHGIVPVEISEAK